jgi:hypothetical protein
MAPAPVTGYQVATLVALGATLTTIITLSILKLHVPAELVAAVGVLIQSMLPSLSVRMSIRAAQASMHPPPLPKKDDSDA